MRPKHSFLEDVGHIALQACQLGTLYRAMRENARKIRLIHCHDALGCERHELFAGLQFGYGGRSGITVMRAASLAFIAAINTVPQSLTAPLGQFAAILYREARQATRSIHGFASLEGSCRASSLTQAAIAASERAWLIGREFKRRDYSSQIEKRAFSGHYEGIVASHKAHAGLRSPVALAQRGSIDAATRCTAFIQFAYVCSQPLQAVAHHLVVVASIGVVGKLRGIIALPTSRVVVHRHYNNTSCTFKQEFGIIAHIEVSRSIVHATVAPAFEPLAVALHGSRVYGMSARYAACIKVELGSPLLDEAFNITWGFCQNYNLAP